MTRFAGDSTFRVRLSVLIEAEDVSAGNAWQAKREIENRLHVALRGLALETRVLVADADQLVPVPA